MDKFTASNGVTIERKGVAALAVERPMTDRLLNINAERVVALREFFRAERDEELGRWRWPLDPDYVVYPRDEYVQVLHEPDGRSGLLGSWTREQAYKFNEDGNLLGLAAEAYFNAHPEPKPWHSAEAGEVWVLSIDGSGDIPCIVTPSGPDFEPISHPVWATFARGSERITAARRIYPEVS